ncbi:MAG: hypothetical protein LBG84_00780 [Treponema sp.]|nr:hypothetical protein [Treponema sp.]
MAGTSPITGQVPAGLTFEKAVLKIVPDTQKGYSFDPVKVEYRAALATDGQLYDSSHTAPLVTTGPGGAAGVYVWGHKNIPDQWNPEGSNVNTLFTQGNLNKTWTGSLSNPDPDTFPYGTSSAYLVCRFPFPSSQLPDFDCAGFMSLELDYVGFCQYEAVTGVTPESRGLIRWKLRSGVTNTLNGPGRNGRFISVLFGNTPVTEVQPPGIIVQINN